MNRKIVLAGGTGFIGRFLQQKFKAEGFDVLIISRGPDGINWQEEKAVIEALNGAACVINLAGKSVDCRYNKRNKELIMRSRVDTTRQLQSCVEKCTLAPLLWINASSATIYRHATDRPMDEVHGEIGNGFSVSVARAWEKAFFERPVAGTRKAALRISIVLGKDGGVLLPYKRLVQYGLGGTQGHGRQMFSWIHIEDVYRIIRFLMAHEDMKGVYNCTAPYPVSNQVLMQTLRGVLKPWLYLPAPRALLEMGALLIGTETELILKSRWVFPQRLLDHGFTFQYPHLETALKDLL